MIFNQFIEFVFPFNGVFSYLTVGITKYYEQNIMSRNDK